MDVTALIEWHAARARGRWVTTKTRRVAARANVKRGFARKARAL